jgi:N-acetylglucosamine kinase-like BadF-type ATPase
MAVALQAAFGDGPGVIVIAGSGSIAYGRNVAEETARAGGWGFAVSDEGSGYWIGREAVSTCLRRFDELGQWDGEFLSELMEILEVSTREQLILTVNGNPPPNFASLVPAALALADRGDETAQTVLSAAGKELAALAMVVLKRLFVNIPSVPVGMSGGVFKNSAFVRQVFYNCLLADFPPATLNPSVIEPVLGALELARKKPAR